MYIKPNHSGTQHCKSTILIKNIHFKKETDIEIRFFEDSFKGRIVSRVSHALMSPLSQICSHGKEQKREKPNSVGDWKLCSPFT